MNRISVLILEIGYWLASVALLAIGFLFFATRFGWWIEELSAFFQGSRGEIALIVLGSISIVLALGFFVRGFAVASRARTGIRKVGPRGPIWISLDAIREFITRSLKEELGLSDARVSLRAAGEGLVVQVRTSLPLHENVTELGERIQDHVKDRVEERIGVTVEQVEVFTQNIRAQTPAAAHRAPPPASIPAAQREEGAYTPIELSRREGETEGERKSESERDSS
jgi:uncharacterized alkaline shock family protein YloU